jgi:hypothetical protein
MLTLLAAAPPLLLALLSADEGVALLTARRLA